VGNSQRAYKPRSASTSTVQSAGTLPPRLANQYEWFFARQFSSAAAFAPVQALLQTLVVSQRPLDESELQLLTGLDANAELLGALRVLSAYVAREEDGDAVRYRLFHRSLAEWLTRPSRRGALHTVIQRLGHAQVAEHLWTNYEAAPEELEAYGLEHLATHLAEVARNGVKTERSTAAERLVDFVLDPVVQELRHDDPLGMVRSLELALAVAAEQTQCRGARACFPHPFS
jgi:hypothetical protein